MKLSATNRFSGEVIDVEVTNESELVNAWKLAQEYDKVAKSLKDQLKKIVPKYVEDGKSEEINGHMFRVSNIQRTTYDKAIMREVFDEDTLDLFLKPDKPKVDKYLKENLEQLGKDSTKLRESMIPDGKPYEVIKLERLDREV